MDAPSKDTTIDRWETCLTATFCDLLPSVNTISNGGTIMDGLNSHKVQEPIFRASDFRTI